MTLPDLLRKVEDQFERLCEQRKASGYPVFGLEHGLERAEYDDLREGLSHEFVRSGHLNSRFWLAWIVVAAEVGYDYDGDEYWRSFANRIPRWEDFGSRKQIRDWFLLFNRKFGGVKPVGRWANQFTIISWPITHSLLPKDLQSHFAQLLYDNRAYLAQNPNLNATEIGEHLRQSAGNHSSRFGYLLQQTALTGSLVQALRAQVLEGSASPISNHALARIVADLEGTRAAKSWLNGVRKAIQDTNLRAAATLSGPRSIVTGLAGSGGHAAATSPRTTLVARRDGNATWSVGFSFPKIRELFKSDKEAIAAIEKTRFKFAHEMERWQPGRGLFSLSDGEFDDDMPLPSGQVIVFERDLGSLQPALDAALTVPGHSLWLLRLHTDGMARQVIGNHVRAGQNYVLFSTSAIAQTDIDDLGMITCEGRSGVHAYEFSPGNWLCSNKIEALKRIGLGFSLGATIEPVGLLPRWEPSVGASVWLPHEEVILRLAADFPARELSISIDGAPPIRIPTEHSQGVICSLGHFAIGEHTVQVSAKPVDPNLADPGVEFMRLLVRAPLPWRDNNQAAGFRAFVDPEGSPLDAVLAGKAKIIVLGPNKRSITISTEFFDRNGHPDGRIKLGERELPVTSPQLQQILDRLAHDRSADALEGSPRVDLLFSADELGVSRLSFQQAIEPVRWRYEIANGQTIARLIDESDDDGEIVVLSYALSRPDKATKLEADQCLDGIVIPFPGALLVAKRGKRSYRALFSVPANGKKIALEDLRLHQSFDVTTTPPRKIARFLVLHRLWENARPLGSLASLRKWQTLTEIDAQIVLSLCGPEWESWARLSASDPVSLSVLQEMQRAIGDNSFAAYLKHIFHTTATVDLVTGASKFAEGCRRYGICSDASITSLAWRLAADPRSVKFDNPGIGEDGFSLVCQNRKLAKGAFFARFLCQSLVANIEPQSGVAA